MIKFGNCSHIIDWDSVIAGIEHQAPAYVGPSHKKGDNIPRLAEVTDLWERAKFVTVHEDSKHGTVGWDMFLSEQFGKPVADKFAEFVGLKKWTSAWISRINVGRMAPWHWDVNDHEKELSKISNIRRFHCHIGSPAHGHILLVEKEVFYNQPQGEVYEWPSRTMWHAGINCGLTPKYLFNIW